MTHAIDTLREALASGDPTRTPFPEPLGSADVSYPIWRLLRSWGRVRDDGGTIGPDQAVLLRQVARWYGGGIHVGRMPTEFLNLGGRADYALDDAGFLRARPFLPTWLQHDIIDSQRGLDRPPELRRTREDIPGEAYLRSVGYERWYSRAQKDAVWTVLTDPLRARRRLSLFPLARARACAFTCWRASLGVLQ